MIFGNGEPARREQVSPASPETTAPSSVASSLARRQQSRRFWLGGAALLLIVLVALGWYWLHRTTPVQYVTAPVTRGDVTRAVTASGTVNPETTVQVGSY